MSETGNPEKVRAARLSVWSNTTLVTLKLIVGLLSGSVSVVSEALHSMSDLLASFIALYTVKISDQPADECHPFGHGKYESLSGLAEALLILGAAIYIVVESVSKLRSGEHPEFVGLGMGVMALSVVVNWLVAGHLFRVAKKTESLALEADAEHLRTDVWTSIGVVLGLGLVALTGNPMFDPLVAMGVALLMGYTSLRLIKDAAGPLLDRQLPEEELEAVRKVFREDPRVLGFHKLRTRKAGAHRHVDAHVQLEDGLSFTQAHDLTEELEDKIRGVLSNAQITLHHEPFRAEQVHQYQAHGGPPPDDDSWQRPASES